MSAPCTPITRSAAGGGIFKGARGGKMPGQLVELLAPLARLPESERRKHMLDVSSATGVPLEDLLAHIEEAAAVQAGRVYVPPAAPGAGAAGGDTGIGSGGISLENEGSRELYVATAHAPPRVRVRRGPSMDTEHVATLQDSKLYADGPQQGDWIKIHPCMLAELRKNAGFVHFDPKKEGFVINRTAKGEVMWRIGDVEG